MRSCQTKHALMCKIHEQDKLYVLTRVLRSLLYVIFFHMHMFHTAVTKILENSLQLIKNVPAYVQFRSLGGTILINGIYRK